MDMAVGSATTVSGAPIHAKSGGGELIDQGVHLIDLAGWFLGSFTSIHGIVATTYFWDMPVDDNAFMTLQDAGGQTAFLHVSCTEWKNLFSFEIYGRDGKLAIDGLGGSYGVERMPFYRMLPEMGPPETTIFEYPGGDRSWSLEFTEFLDDIHLARDPSAGLGAARAALVVAEEVYAQSNRSSAATDPALADDHHTQSASNHSWRRRDGPAVLLPRARRISHCRRHRQVRLRHGHASVLDRASISSTRSWNTSRRVDEVHHPIIREAIKLLGFRTPQVEITTLADIPAGTGLGSSGSFTTALLKALYAHRRRLLHPNELAELACEIEIDRLQEPIGKQDQYIAAYGGLTCFTFHKDGKVEAEPAQSADGRDLQPRGQSAAVLHGLLAQRQQHPVRPTSPYASATMAKCCATCTTSRSSACAVATALESGNIDCLRRTDA